MKKSNIKKAVHISLFASIFFTTPQIYFSQTTVQTASVNTSKIWGGGK